MDQYFFNLVTRVVDEVETYNLKLEECKSDYDKRVNSMTFDSEMNRMIFTNSKSWLFNCLLSIGKDMVKVFSDWRSNAQRNVDSIK